MVSVVHWPVVNGLFDKTKKDFSLKLIKDLLAYLGNPHLELKNVIHVGGTNGKGSTTAYIANILRKSGYSANLYTSPHIYEYNERIKLNGSNISDDKLSLYMETIRFFCEKHSLAPSMFEATTAAAFLAFKDHPADANIIEVGMGGRLDATNVFDENPAITAILTPIHVDHADFLGKTPAENAIEKSFIIKPKSKIVLSYQSADVMQILSARIAECGARFWSYDYNYTMDLIEELPDCFAVTVNDLPHIIKKPKLIGRHQYFNAATAATALLINSDTFPNVSEESIGEGLSTVEWPMRLEEVSCRALLGILPVGSKIWMDGAHNASGAAVVADFLKTQPEIGWKNYLIVGRSKYSNGESFVVQFKGVVEKIYAVRVRLESLPQSPELIMEASNKVGIESTVAESIDAALTEISSNEKSQVRVVICGSLYLARDVKRHCSGC